MYRKLRGLEREQAGTCRLLGETKIQRKNCLKTVQKLLERNHRPESLVSREGASWHEPYPRASQYLVCQDLFIFHSKSQIPCCFSLSLHKQTQMFVRTADGGGRGSLPLSSAGLNQRKKHLFLEKAQFILQLSGLFGVFPLLRF